MVMKMYITTAIASLAIIGYAVGKSHGSPTVETTVVNPAPVVTNITFKRETQLDCLAKAIYAEARDQPYAGQHAVGEVIMNRVRDKRYPHTICEVTRYKRKGVYHFSFQNPRDPNFDTTARVFADMKTNRIEVEAREKAYEIAYSVKSGTKTISTKVLNYHSYKVTPTWSKSPQMTKYASIADHHFYTGF